MKYSNSKYKMSNTTKSVISIPEILTIPEKFLGYVTRYSARRIFEVLGGNTL